MILWQINDVFYIERINEKNAFFIFQNGYPARRRSLVDDARFETLVVKQTKQSVLEEARQRANGKFDMSFFEHVYVLE